MNDHQALQYAKTLGLPALDMGSAHGKPDGYLGLDKHPHPNVDIVTDITNGIPLPDNSIAIIRAHDFIEHIPNPIQLFNEFHRILTHNGILLTHTPSTDGRGAYQDPTHITYWNENSFWYYTDPNYKKYVPEITCNFQIITLETTYPTGWHLKNQIPYVTANLQANKQSGVV